MSKKLLVALMLCLSLLTSTSSVMAQIGQKAEEDVLSKLRREGWKIVGDGILRRELRAGEVETFVFGPQGFTWKIQSLRAQLRKLRAEFQAHPTPELRKAIAAHRKLIASAQKALAHAKSAEELGETSLSKEDCSVTLAYDAAASYKTDVPGIWASASASFSTACEGSSGDVYAYAFAKAYVNGAVTTETVTDGPRSGSSVSASAYASRNGSNPCESSSFSEIFSSSSNPTSYSKSAEYFSCLPPLQASFTSPVSSLTLWDGECRYLTWTVSISGGTPPYTTKIYLNNILKANATSYSELVCGANANTTFTINARADVNDSAGQAVAPRHSTLVVSRVTSGGGCTGPSLCEEP